MSNVLFDSELDGSTALSNINAATFTFVLSCVAKLYILVYIMGGSLQAECLIYTPSFKQK